jgi:cell wall-associated NlpC family hydrolase
MLSRRALVRIVLPVSLTAVVLGAPALPAGASPNAMTPVVHDPADPAVKLAIDALDALTEGRAAHYSFLRHDLAEVLAPRLEVDAEQLDAVWKVTDPRRMTVVLAALSQLGAPYRFASSDPTVGFDCSGFTRFAWRQVGIELDNQSRGQINSLTNVDPVWAKPGDVLWYPGHVMLSLGLPGSMVNAVNGGNPVTARTLGEGRMSRLRAGDPLAGVPELAPVGNIEHLTISPTAPR